MRRRVCVDNAVLEAIVGQLERSMVSAERFVARDLRRELRLLAEHYDELPAHGPGRRHTQHEPENVELFHVFAALDLEGAVVVYHVDIWSRNR